MKKYLILFIPIIAYVIVDLLNRKKESYPESERLSNLEKAREAKKAKSILKDHESFQPVNTLENEN